MSEPGSNENDFDPVHGNVVHVYGRDAEADRAYDAMLAKQAADQEQLAIRVERESAAQLGVLKEFEEHVSKGRFRDFMPYLNRLKVEKERRLERKVYFGLGIVVGFVVACLLFAR